MAAIRFHAVAELPLGEDSRIHEHGAMSWTPTATYRIGIEPHRVRGRLGSWHYAPDQAVPSRTFPGAGLLAVQPAPGQPVLVFAARDAFQAVPRFRATVADGRLDVSADGPVDVGRHETGMEHALARWADGFARRMGVGGMRRAPTVWCSWYHDFDRVTEQDIVENLEAMRDQDLPVEVLQIDDGYQAQVGDWLTRSDPLRSVPDLASRIRDDGFRPGIWLAPFMAPARSALVRDHPHWLLSDADGKPVDAGWNWDTDPYGLDLTLPEVREHLAVFATFRRWGYDYFKLDFLVAGALPGRRRADVSGVTRTDRRWSSSARSRAMRT